VRWCENSSRVPNDALSLKGDWAPLGLQKQVFSANMTGGMTGTMKATPFSPFVAILPHANRRNVRMVLTEVDCLEVKICGKTLPFGWAGHDHGPVESEAMNLVHHGKTSGK